MALVRTSYANFAAFPPIGAVDIIYVDLSNGNEYTWVTSAYVAYTPTLVGVSLGDKSASWFTANPGLLLAKGQVVFLDDQSGQFKKGDGVTALSALSFLGGGGSQDLQDVTDNGNVTTNPILFDDGLGNQTVEVGADQINVLDSTLALNLFNVDRSTDTVQILGEDVATLNDIPSLTGYEQTANKSSSYTASSTTTYANTKALVDGLDSRLFTVSFESGTFSPADGAILYMSDVRIVPNNSPPAFAFNLGYAYKIIGVKIGVGNNTTAGSTEDVVGKIYHLGTASSSLVGNFKTNGSVSAIASSTITGLNISVGASDEIAFRMEFPTYATNPAGCIIFVTLICKTV